MSLKTKISKYGPWALSIFITFVFVQSLFFKFSNAPETQHIFQTLNAWGADTLGIDGLFIAPGIFNQYVIGSAELVALVLLIGGLVTGRLILNAFGALLAVGIMTGAIFFHLATPLGVDVQGDGGVLFGMAVGVWLSSLILLYVRKDLVCGLMKCGTCKS